ncbi:DUF3892 domain-containing protein [Sphingomonas sp.]|uniref:DUF3892 domain-containing protein n=1 Tax=Sphingomonas sp. TaxID=28214 RepID=UPI000DB58F01|nr:DUF3892 domain-containing protein [Sphingomonas sp.]PZU10104.1 MAG: hypothetical protein DI605_05775 [Sphingomonas sp.]
MASLLVPIALDVLIVRSQGAGADWAETAMRAPKAQANRVVRQQLDADPFETMAEGRAPGAYLHWALPDALTSGVVDANGVEMPAVPDRWMVLRLTTPPGAVQRKVDAWIIPDAGADMPVVVGDLLAAVPPAVQPSTPKGELTALGIGSFGWAAYFDNVAGRFALYDDLVDVAGPVAYLVCGWYADPAKDPVAASTESDFLDRLDDRDWSLARPLATGEAFPDRCLFHAAALALGWPKADWTVGDPGQEGEQKPDLAGIEVAIGETLAEAVVAIVANDLDATASRILEARLAGLIGDATGMDGLAKLDAALSAARFGSAPTEGGSETVWKPGDADGTGSFRAAARTGPRRWQATNPAIVLQGAARSAKHGGDGRFGENDDLICRLEADVVTAFGITGGGAGGAGASMLPAAPLAPIPADYGMPAVVVALLGELASLDPGSAPDLDQATATDPSPIAAARARWWQSFAAGADEAMALAGAEITGILPSPVAITPPLRPWTPLHLDWTVSYLPSPHGTHDWDLGDSDFSLPSTPAVPADDAAVAISGRSLLSAAPSRLLEFAIADGGDAFDLVGGALESFTAQLRGDPLTARVTADHGRLDAPAPIDPRPAHFRPLRSGFLRVDRLRLVDGFGQYVDLAAPPVVAIGSSLATPGHASLAALRPRFTAPAQVLLRFMDAAGSATEASEAVTPVCGFLLPSPRDGSLALFDAAGIGLGALRPDGVDGAAWEEAPGQPSGLGARPGNQIGNAVLGGFADRLLDIDVAAKLRGEIPGALSALLRIIDATRWSTDLTGASGDEHLSLILGRPAVLVQASISIDIFDRRDPPENATTAVPVRLGTLAQASDGLLGYFVAGDYSVLHLIDPGVAELAETIDGAPLSETFVDRSGVFYINPGLSVPLTLIMEPGAGAQVTTGVLPQKEIGLRREWTSAALSRLSPTLRFGPVLRDPQATRLPVASDIRGDWLWHRRPDPVSWTSDEVVPATTAAQLSESAVVASDGWLQVKLIPDGDYREGAIGVRIRYATRARSGAIETIGGLNEDGTVFTMPVGQAVQLQESGRFRFFVQQGTEPEAALLVVHMRSGRRYMRTHADRASDNNLANLPPPPMR